MTAYTGVVSQITGDFKFILVAKDIITLECYVNSLNLKEIVRLLDIGEVIKVKGEVQTYKMDYFRQKLDISMIVKEIIG